MPWWLNELQGEGLECFRCNKTLWRTAMQAWVTAVVEQVKPFMARNGGPIIMLQASAIAIAIAIVIPIASLRSYSKM